MGPRGSCRQYHRPSWRVRACYFVFLGYSCRPTYFLPGEQQPTERPISSKNALKVACFVKYLNWEQSSTPPPVFSRCTQGPSDRRTKQHFSHHRQFRGRCHRSSRPRCKHVIGLSPLLDSTRTLVCLAIGLKDSSVRPPRRMGR